MKGALKKMNGTREDLRKADPVPPLTLESRPEIQQALRYFGFLSFENSAGTGSAFLTLRCS